MRNMLARALVAALLMLSGGQLLAGLDEVAALIDAGRPQDALEQLRAEPESRRSRLLHAAAMAANGRTDEAVALYRNLIDEAPQDPVPYNNLAVLLASNGRLQESSELLAQAMKSDERYATIYKNLSRVYVEMSRNSYAKALRLEEQQPAVQLLSLNHHDIHETPLEPTAAELPVIAEAAVISGQVVPTASVAVPNGETAIAALQQWASAWSSQDVEGYLNSYDAAYQPPRGLSLQQWQAERRRRLVRPSGIEVALSDFEVMGRGDDSLTVKLSQRYRSEHYRDHTRKGFVMVSREEGWKILSEYTIEVLEW